MKHTLLAILFLSLLTSSQAQEGLLSGVVRGVVLDQVNQRPLEGATLELNSEVTPLVSGENGSFRWEGIKPGRYTLLVRYLGYQAYFLPELLVETGKELVIEIPLSPIATSLETVEVTADPYALTKAVPGIQTITIEEVFRLPATFYDPARLVTLLPGVVGDNDQANGISVRGNSPNMLSWQLEGVEIVNPNHTPNAGTGTDRVTQNGGGVNMLSAQMLSSSQFMNGAFTAGHGNALSAIMDMKFRKGNNEQNEYIVQAGLIGIDLAAEGPLSKTSGSSFLANYRYSTIGLLSAMGVDLGDEAISFQDFSFNLHFPLLQSGGSISLFGMGGNSKNIFEAQRDAALWEFEKDNRDITFTSLTGALGAKWIQPVGAKGVLNTVVVLSSMQTERLDQQLEQNSFKIIETAQNFNNQSKVAIKSEYSADLGAGTLIKGGINLTNTSFAGGAFTSEVSASSLPTTAGWLTSPYLSLEHNGLKWKVNGGIHLTSFSLTEDFYVEPRVQIGYDATANSSFFASYGMHSQLQPGVLYFADLVGATPQMSRAHHVVAGWDKNLGKGVSLQTNIFYQKLFNIPVAANLSNAFSAINLLEEIPGYELANEGTGQNIGVELSLRKFMQNNFYYLLNATVYDAKFEGSDGITRDSRYNGQYTVNATLGKEWRKQKSAGLERVHGWNIRIVNTGGFRATPIDLAASQDFGRTIYDLNNAFQEQLPGYFRVDLRWYVKRNKPGKVSTFSIDIQNLTNAQNVAFSYYDVLQGALVEKYQLGIIPLLSWRLEF
jgi:hypothetical protein